MGGPQGGLTPTALVLYTLINLYWLLSDLRIYVIALYVRLPLKRAIIFFKRDRRRCSHCKNIIKTGVSTSNCTQESFQMRYSTSCTSQNVIYLIECKHCNINQGNATNVALHFNSDSHLLDDFRFVPIDIVNNEMDRLCKETYWIHKLDTLHPKGGERGGSVVECRTPEREVGGSIPTAAVLCPWARHFTPRKYWLITQEAVAPSRHDWKIVDWDVKPQHKQTNHPKGMNSKLLYNIK